MVYPPDYWNTRHILAKADYTFFLLMALLTVIIPLFVKLYVRQGLLVR